ncbi:MAG: hypothetical protein BWY45_02579 [Euryarchaeota archaeon ADurb.Bin294]|nr:MAG: hypothetical protein BWY45_02579 [Euryarchaeota archaeon ADurb.Bin294]
MSIRTDTIVLNRLNTTNRESEKRGDEKKDKQKN